MGIGDYVGIAIVLAIVAAIVKFEYINDSSGSAEEDMMMLSAGVGCLIILLILGLISIGIFMLVT